MNALSHGSVIMIRAACALIGLFAVGSAGPAVDVDAMVFVRAFRAGTADQYRNQLIRGRGVNFHGAIAERIADGTTRTSLVITVGAGGEGATPTVIRTWAEFVAAERARTTLVVALSGESLAVPSGPGPEAYEFSGVFNGQVRTIVRVPDASDSTIPDSGPCKGEQPQGAAGSFYCAPLLVSAGAARIGELVDW
jgi:hypothetical protein